MTRQDMETLDRLSMRLFMGGVIVGIQASCWQGFTLSNLCLQSTSTTGRLTVIIVSGWWGEK
jgi:hypothetical protein